LTDYTHSMLPVNGPALVTVTERFGRVPVCLGFCTLAELLWDISLAHYCFGGQR